MWAGLDLGETSASLCLIDEHGATALEIACPAEAQTISALLEPFGPQLRSIAAEAGVGTPLVRRLQALGYPISTFEVRKTRAFLSVRRNKTDDGDARGLAELARASQTYLLPVHIKRFETQRLRMKLALRQGLVRQRVAAEGMLRSLLLEFGGKPPRVFRASSLRAGYEREMARLAESGIVDPQAELSPLISLAEQLRKQKEALDKELKEIAANDAVCQRLMKVPGVGPVCAISFMSAVEEPTRFQRASDVGAYLGLTPVLYQSGKTSKRRGISKMGNKMTRFHLSHASVSLLYVARTECALQQWGLALAERIGAGRARVAVARKLAVLLLKLWRDEIDFEAFPGRAMAGI